MAQLQVLNAPTNQPVLNPVVQPTPVQPVLSPKVVTKPVQPVLSPTIVTKPIQPTLTPKVQTQPQGFGKITTVGTATEQQPFKPKLSIDEFAQTIKQKYPQYTDKDNAALVKAIVAKYPEYADKVNIPTVTKTPSFGENVVSGIGEGLKQAAGDAKSFVGGLISPLTESATSFLRALQATPDIVRGVFGNEEAQGRAAETLAKPIAGVTPLAGLTPTQAVGRAVKTAAFALPEIEGVPNAFGKATGAATGATFGFGSSLENGDSGKGILLNTILSALGGHAAQTYLPVLANKLVQPNIVTDFVGNGLSKVEDKLSQSVVDSYKKILNLNSRQLAIEERFAKNTPEFLAKEGIRLDVSGGKLDATQAIRELESKADIENNLFSSLLKSENKYAAIDDIFNNAKANIKASGTDYDKAIAHIDAEQAAYKRQYAQFASTNAKDDMVLPLDKINEIKQSFWKRTRGFGSPDAELINQTNFQLGNAAKDVIENNVTDISVKKINQRLGNISAAEKLLNKRNGMPVQGGRTNRIISRIIGGIAGAASGNPLSAFGGAFGAEKLAGFLQDSQIAYNAKLNVLEKLRGSKEGSEIVNQMEKLLKSRAEDILNRKQLGAGNGVIYSPQPTRTYYSQGKGLDVIPGVPER